MAETLFVVCLRFCVFTTNGAFSQAVKLFMCMFCCFTDHNFVSLIGFACLPSSWPDQRDGLVKMANPALRVREN